MTLQDCIDRYEIEGIETIINDGGVIEEGEKDLLEGNLRASRLRCEQLEEKLQCVNDMLEQCERGMRHKDNGTADKRAGSREIVLRGSQYLPTMNGFVQMEFRPAKIVDGCVSTKK